MTDYHPVTREELEQIEHGCASPSTDSCEECKFIKPDGRCGFHKHIIMIASRPDPLALLEAWTQQEFQKIGGCEGYEETIDFLKNLIYNQQETINKLRTNPDAVRELGVREGWFK